MTAVAPRADHHDPLAGVVEVLGPVLRVDHVAGEVPEPGQLGPVPPLVVEVAGAGPQERARQLTGALAGLDGDRPARGVAVPLGLHHPVVVADVPVDAVLPRGLAQVVEDQRAVGQRLGASPRPEAVAEREHVGVRPDPGVAEQVPGPAAHRARLEDGVRRRGVLAGELAGRADAGQPGSEDQHVEVVGHPVETTEQPSARVMVRRRARREAGHMRIEVPPFERHEELVALALDRSPHATRGEVEHPFVEPHEFLGLQVRMALDDQGALLGWGAVARQSWNPPGSAVLMLHVAGGHEGRGVGSALHAMLRPLVPPGTTSLRTRVFDDEERSFVIARRWGFLVEEHSINSSMPLAGVHRARAAGRGDGRAPPRPVLPRLREVDAMLVRSQTNPEARPGSGSVSST